MDVDGSNGRYPTTGSFGGWFPQWSPDGSSIAIFSNDFDIWLVGTDGSNLREIHDAPRRARYLSWSPDGLSIIYSTSFNQFGDIFLLDVQSGSAIQLTDDPALEVQPDWSPNGSRIVYMSRADDSAGSLFTMNPDGTDKRAPLTNDTGSDFQFPSWSPDGAEIAHWRGGELWAYEISSRASRRVVGADAGRI